MIKKFSFFSILFLLACSSGREYRANPLDTFIRDYDQKYPYTIILEDMDVDGTFFKSYKHQYKIIYSENGEPKETTTGMIEVPTTFFWKNQNNVGMEIVSKDSTGKVNKVATPPGYSNYVGNPRYGHWENRDGSSFWSFYGKYAFLSSMFNLMSPVPRYGYSDYRRNYRYNRPYYGSRSSSGYYTYGSQGRNMRASRPSFSRRFSNIRQKSRSFRDRARSRVSGSRYSRSSSRYRSNFSFRSRGRGFGK